MWYSIDEMGNAVQKDNDGNVVRHLPYVEAEELGLEVQINLEESAFKKLVQVIKYGRKAERKEREIG